VIPVGPPCAPLPALFPLKATMAWPMKRRLERARGSGADRGRRRVGRHSGQGRKARRSQG
jgi:hypothetical protein